MDDEFEWDRDEVMDLGACDVTGDPQLDQFGYQSPSRRRPNLTGYHPGPERDWLANARAYRAQCEQRRREAVADNLREKKRRIAERRGTDSGTGQPDLAPHVARAVAAGMTQPRDLGWWRIDVDSTGRAVWTKVDAPGDGPRITVEQPAPRPWAPVEMTEPSPGTQLW